MPVFFLSNFLIRTMFRPRFVKSWNFRSLLETKTRALRSRIKSNYYTNQKMKTKTIAILAAAAGLVSAANINAQEVSWEANVGFESEYVFRGVQIAGPSIQGGIDGAAGDAYFGLWVNESLETADRLASEIDLYAGWGFAVDDTTTIDLGATLYHYPDFDDETFEIYVGASFDTSLAPSIYAYYDFDVEALTLEGAIGHSVAIDDTASVDFGLTLGWVDIDGAGDYTYYGATADYVYSLSETSSVSFGVRYSNTDISGRPHSDGNLWGGFSFVAGF